MATNEKSSAVLTDAKIKKALECCFDFPFGNCSDCPLRKYDTCLKKLPELALDLINRLEEENVNYSRNNRSLTEAATEMQKALKKQSAEIERLKLITTSNPYCVSIGTADIFTANHEEYEQLLANIKAEAVKEFAERLKDTISYLETQYFDEDITMDEIREEIDNLVKEMVGE